MRHPKRRQRLSTPVKVTAWILTIALLAVFAYLLYEAWAVQIFSDAQILVAGGLILILILCLIWGMFRRRTDTWKRVLIMILCAALSAGLGVGGYYIQATSDFFSAIGLSRRPSHSGSNGNGSNEDDGTNDAIANEAAALSEKMAVTVTTYAMKVSEIHSPADLSGKKIGTVQALDPQGTENALRQLENSGMKDAETVEYADQFTLVTALYDNVVDAIILPEQYHADLLEAADDVNQYNALTTFTDTVDQYIYYEDIPEDVRNEPDEVDDITKDPFVVMISGSDSYGTLNPKSRADVNMLAAVNPQTHEVLLVSIPRDAYMSFSCKKNAQACGYAAGQMDKLTHSGIYGIGTTESSIEDFLDIDINYTVQVNFSSLINVVDAIGGIDVEVEPGLEVETFYANGTEGVHEGVNHLDGERALAFARERHAYQDGDNQRIKNQQIVMKAILKSMLNPSMLFSYPAFLRALSTAFTTNMPSEQIRELIRLEVSSFPSWNIQSYALAGDSSTEFCAALGTNAYVTLVYESNVQTAHELIEDVIRGRKPEIPEPSTDTSYSTGSQKNQNESEAPDQEPVPYDPYGYGYGNYDPNAGNQQTPVQDPGYSGTEPIEDIPYDPGQDGTGGSFGEEVPVDPGNTFDPGADAGQVPVE